MSIQLTSSDGSILTQQIGSCSWDITVPENTENNLLYGGVVTWLQDYDFHVSPAGYYINGVFYESPEAFVTLSPADPTLDRFDVIYVDADGIVKVLEGIPSLTPAQPGLDLGLQLGLGVIYVQAGSSSPVDLTLECLSGWTSSGSDGDIDPASPNANCVDSTGLEVTQGDNGDYALWDRGTTFNPSADFNVLTFRLKPKGDWSNDPNLNHRIKLQWYLSGIPVGSAVFMGHTGFSFNIFNYTCQIVSIPIIQFGLSPTALADQLRITVISEYNPPSYPFGFYLDGICMQGGIFGATESDDIHNQYFGPQTPGRFWIQGNGRADGWFTSPMIVNGAWQGGEKFGWASSTQGTGNTAVGFLATANGQEGATALGCQTLAAVGVAVGLGAYANRSVAVGGSGVASGSTVVGGGAYSDALSGVAIGGNAATTNYFSSGAIALGYYARVDSGYGSIAIGVGANSTGHFASAAIGIEATTTASFQFMIGGDTTYTDTGYQSLWFGSGETSPFVANRFWSVTGAVGTDIAGTSWTFAGAKGTGTGNSGPILWQTSDPTTTGTTLQSLSTKMGLNSNTLGFYMDGTRFQMDEGADVVAAGDLTLGTGNAFTITGDTDINAITSTNWQDGAVVYLLFTGTPTVQHNTLGGAGTAPIRLAGATDFSVTNNTVLQLQYKDFYWREVGRTQASAIGPYTFLNGLHEDVGGLAKLGGTLIEDTTITLGANDFVLDRTSTGDIQFQGLANSVTANVIFYDTVTGTITYGLAPGGGGGDVTANNGITENVADNVQWGGTLVQATNIAQAGYAVTFTHGAGRTFNVDPTNQIYQLGAIDSVFPNSNSSIGVDDAQQRFLFSTVNGRFLDVNQSVDTYQMGDIDDWGTGLKMIIANGIDTFLVSDAGENYLSLDGGNKFFNMGSTNQGLQIDGVNRITVIGDIQGTNNVTTLQITDTNQSVIVSNARFQEDEGADVVAANDLTLSAGGNAITVTGNTQVNAITTLNWQEGSTVKLHLTGTPTLKHNTAGGGGTAPLRLAGATDFVVAGYSVLELQYKDGYWNEVGRAVEVGTPITGISANNGLTENVANNVQLGSTGISGSELLHHTYINNDTFNLNIRGSATNLIVQNIGSNTAGYFTSAATSIIAEGGTHGINTSGSVIGLTAGGTTTASLPLWVASTDTGTNTSKILTIFQRNTSGTAANGFGGSLEFIMETATSQGTTHLVTSSWTDATHASRTSQLIIAGVNNAVTADLLTLDGDGQLRLNKYGVGTFPDTPAYALGVDASGNVIEFTPGVGGGFITADNGLNASTATNVQLGGPLLQDTTIDVAGFDLNIESLTSTNYFRYNGNAGVDPYMEAHFENLADTRYTDFQFYNDGFNLLQVYDAGANDLQANNGGIFIASTDGTGDSYLDVSASGYMYFRGSNGIYLDASAFQQTLATPTTAANDLALTLDGNLFFVNGGTQINAILSNDWQAGAIITFEFTGVGGVPLIKHNTAGGAGTAAIMLAGAEDFQAAAEDVLHLIYDGGLWHELSRKLAAATSGPTITLNNGLTKNTATNGQLGGTLIQSTTINSNTFPLIITGAVTTASLQVTNTDNASAVPAIQGISSGTTGVGVRGVGNNNVGVLGIATAGAGVYGQATSGVGGNFSATTGIAGQFQHTPATANTVVAGLFLGRFSGGGTPAAGIGTAINMAVHTDGGGTAFQSSSLESKWVDATHASRTAQFDLNVTNNAAANTIMSAYGTGVVGIGISSGYVATRLDVVNDSLAGNSIARFKAATTGATGSTQRGVEVLLSGANAGSFEATYGLYVSNTHSGTNPVNVGVFSVVSGVGQAFYANQIGAGDGMTIIAQAGKGLGVQSNDGIPGHFLMTTTSTNVVKPSLVLYTVSSGTAANGLGTSIVFETETSTGSERITNTIESEWTDATDGSRTSVLTITGVTNTNTGDIVYFEGDKRVRFEGRIEGKQGADVASAAGAIALGLDGNTFEITGTNAITLISNVGWQNGSEVNLVFTSTASLTSGTANSGTDIGLVLQGAATFNASADDMLTLVLCEVGGTQKWREKSRSVN